MICPDGGKKLWEGRSGNLGEDSGIVVLIFSDANIRSDTKRGLFLLCLDLTLGLNATRSLVNSLSYFVVLCMYHYPKDAPAILLQSVDCHLASEENVFHYNCDYVSIDKLTCEDQSIVQAQMAELYSVLVEVSEEGASLGECKLTMWWEVRHDLLEHSRW